MSGNRFLDDNWRSPKNILDLLRTLALAGVGVSSLYMFFTFDRKKSEHELAVLTSSQLAPWHDVEISDLGPEPGTGKRKFRVRYHWTLKNTGSSKNEVTYVIVRGYKATLPPLDDNVVAINRFNEEGAIEWDAVFNKGWYYGPKWSPEKKFLDVDGRKVVYSRGGGGVAVLDTGEDSDASVDLLVVADADDLIGFEMWIALNGGENADDVWHLSESRFLGDPYNADHARLANESRTGNERL